MNIFDLFPLPAHCPLIRPTRRGVWLKMEEIIKIFGYPHESRKKINLRREAADVGKAKTMFQRIIRLTSACVSCQSNDSSLGGSRTHLWRRVKCSVRRRTWKQKTVYSRPIVMHNNTRVSCSAKTVSDILVAAYFTISCRRNECERPSFDTFNKSPAYSDQGLIQTPWLHTGHDIDHVTGLESGAENSKSCWSSPLNVIFSSLTFCSCCCCCCYSCFDAAHTNS